MTRKMRQEKEGEKLQKRKRQRGWGEARGEYEVGMNCEERSSNFLLAQLDHFGVTVDKFQC
jgi:hypothetical protein